VAAALDELTALATELRATVRRQRMAACPPPPADAGPVPGRAVRRGGRASLHASPLLELFRATGPAG
jgi:hypothetical protein